MWLRDADGCYWSHIPGVYGPFLGLERGGSFEGHELEWAASHLSAGSFFIDVGANIGVFAIRLLRRSRDTSGLAIEPVGGTHRALSANLERNGLASRLVALQAAVGEDENNVLITSGLNAANHVVPRTRTRASASEELVPQVTLDHLAARRGLGRVDLLKIDVEGFELAVLKGARDLLTNSQPAVLMEIEERWATRYGYAAADLVHLMKSFGYDYQVFADALQDKSGDLDVDLARANNFLFLPTTK